MEDKRMKNAIRYSKDHVRLKTGEYQKADGSYEYRYAVFGRSFSFYSKTLENLREKEAQITSQQNEFRKTHLGRTLTLDSLFDLWRQLKRGIRDRTFQHYCDTYQRYVMNSIGRQYVSSLKKSDIKRFYNYLADERRLQIGTIESVHTVLHQILQLAVDDELIASNPADSAVKELMRARNIDHRKPTVLTTVQQNLLMQFVSESPIYSRGMPIISVLLGTGMRVGELTGLRWCDVDFQKREIDINHALVYYNRSGQHCTFGINDTKTPASKRVIPMTDSVKDAFLKERAYQAENGLFCQMDVDGYSDFIFLNRFGYPLQQNVLNKAFQRIIRDCNDQEFLKSNAPAVLLPHFSCHSLRHTFATNLARNPNISVKVAQYLLGHADVTTTLNIYSHCTEEMMENARNALDSSKFMHE